MADRISNLPLFLIAALIFCYAFASLPSIFIDDYPIRVVSDGLRLSTDHDPRRTVEAIYQFGDSLSDTGNYIREDPLSSYAKLPYGQTLYKPTGRCSNGLLMIDYFTEFFKLPFLDPYLDKDGNFSHGVNFAVSGATALSCSTLATKDITYCDTNSSLLVQLDWFKSHLYSIYSSASERKEKLANSLILMGEIGGNDYNWALLQRKPIFVIYELVPDVVQVTKKAIEEVVHLGATQIVVPGNFPIGCLTCYLDMYRTDDAGMYDEFQCLKNLNTLVEFHNNMTQNAIKEVKKDHPDVTIVYGDYVSAFQEILQHATSLGFDKDVMHEACCVNCGSKGSPVCEDPDKHVSWDGVHLTQHAYQIIAEWLIKHTSTIFHETSHV